MNFNDSMNLQRMDGFKDLIVMYNVNDLKLILFSIRPLLKNEGQGDERNPMGLAGAGSGCAGLFRCGKGTTWEGGQRVPGIISYPSKIDPGTSHALTSALDILPTFISMAGGDVDDNGVGYDLSELLFNDAEVK